MANSPRTRTVKFKTSLAERRMLRRRAVDQDLSLSAFIRLVLGLTDPSASTSDREGPSKDPGTSGATHA
jgi:hypothetical protein